MRRISTRDINRVGVVDDEPSAREGYQWTLEDADVTPVLEGGPLGSLEDYLAVASGRLDAVLCDQHLKIRNYARFNGAELAARLYERNVPAVVCTNYQDAHIDQIRKHRSQIPVLMRWTELDPDSFIAALEVTIKELQGEFASERRPWRSLVHITDDGEQEKEKFFYVELPGWTSDERIRLVKEDIPPCLRPHVLTDAHLYAEVNIGAEFGADLYFVNWELG
jgi:DNA-binding NarL/FixJ family response regulator